MLRISASNGRRKSLRWFEKEELRKMLLKRAEASDVAAIVELANLAYRGASGQAEQPAGQQESWCSESEIIEGLRLTETQLQEDLAAKPDAFLLTSRDNPEGPLLGTVWLEPIAGNAENSESVWYLGLLTVTPKLQNRRLGRTLLADAEAFARDHGAERMRMTVVNARDTLIAWYLRRGYVLTRETVPFPYDDQRFGKPLRNDLHFVVLEKPL
jgi:GNAT superfamily N-acetyltransferase